MTLINKPVDRSLELNDAKRLLIEGRDSAALAAVTKLDLMTGEFRETCYETAAQALRNMGEIERAMNLLEFAIQNFPGNVQFRYIRATMLLGLGRYAEAWPDYELRLKGQQRCYLPRSLKFPRWPGITDSTRLDRPNRVLVWSEQGFGDEIMFASALPEASSVANFAVECSIDCAPILRRSLDPHGIDVYAREFNGGIPSQLHGQQFDYEIPIASLPGALGWNKPKRDAYLTSEWEQARLFREALRVKAEGRPIIGVSWKGGTFMTRNVARSIDLDLLRPILDQDALFVSLQHNVNENDLLKLATMDNVQGRFFVNSLQVKTLDGIAALVSASDAVVSVCNTNIHLAGAMGKPVFCLAPYVPEWRYGFEGEMMPWYPNVRMFRQHRYDDWSDAIARCARELYRFIKTNFVRDA